MNIVVTGSIAYDYLMSFPGHFKEHILPDRIDSLSLSFLVDTLVRRRGGCAANIAYTLALLGERPHVLATVGEDFAEYRAWLSAQGVDCSAIVEVPGESTASFFVNTDRSGSQIASFYTGAMAHAHTLSFRAHLSPQPELAIISPNDPRAMVRYAQECQALRIRYIYDPSQQIVRLDAEELLAGVRGCFLLIVNDYEFELLRRKTGLEVATVLQSAEAVIVTRGEEGSTVYTRDGEAVSAVSVPAVPERRKSDPTGVGDAYRGGLMKGLALGLDWTLAARLGSLAATYTLEQQGPQSHRYTPAEFVARFREHYDDAGQLAVLCGEPSV